MDLGFDAFFILGAFFPGSRSCADNPNLSTALAMRDEQQLSFFSMAYCNLAQLGLGMVGVVERQGRRVAKYLRGLFQADAVFARVCRGLFLIPLKVHRCQSIACARTAWLRMAACSALHFTRPAEKTFHLPYDPPEHFRPWEWRLGIFLGLLATFFGAYGLGLYQSTNHEPSDPWSIAYHTLQLFALHAPHLEHAVPWQLNLGRWLAAIVVLGAVARGLQLAREFRNAGNCVIAIEANPDPPSATPLTMPGLP